MRIAARFQVKHRGGVANDLLVVNEELFGRGIKISEAGGVGWSARICKHWGV